MGGAFLLADEFLSVTAVNRCDGLTGVRLTGDSPSRCCEGVSLQDPLLVVKVTYYSKIPQQNKQSESDFDQGLYVSGTV